MDTVLVRNIVLADVDVEPISPRNMPPTRANSEAAMENNAMRVVPIHSFLMKYFVVHLLNMILIK